MSSKRGIRETGVAGTIDSDASDLSTISDTSSVSNESKNSEEQSAAATTSKPIKDREGANGDTNEVSYDESCAATALPENDVVKWEECSVATLKSQKGGESSSSSEESSHSHAHFSATSAQRTHLVEAGSPQKSASSKPR